MLWYSISWKNFSCVLNYWLLCCEILAKIVLSLFLRFRPTFGSTSLVIVSNLRYFTSLPMLGLRWLGIVDFSNTICSLLYCYPFHAFNCSYLWPMTNNFQITNSWMLQYSKKTIKMLSTLLYWSGVGIVLFHLNA